MRKAMNLCLGLALAVGCAGFVRAQDTVEKDKVKVSDNGDKVKQKTKVKDTTGKHKSKVKVKDKGDTTVVKEKDK